MTPGKFVLHQTKQRKGQAIYVYYMIAWYYRENHKPLRRIIKHLGRLTPQEIDFYKKSIACLNRESGFYPCTLSQLCVRESKTYLSCAVGVHLWDQWRLSQVFATHDAASQAEVSLAEMTKILTILRAVRPCSHQLETELYRETCLSELTGVPEERYNTSRVFRTLSVLERYRTALGRHIFDRAVQRGETHGDVVFYDLSSGNLSGLRCVMARWGHCKDGYQRHVVLVLVITREGHPIYWDVLEGNTVEVHTLQGVITEIEQLYGRLNAVLCFDRGLVSDENLQWLAGRHIHFITVLDGNQVSHFDEVIPHTVLQQARALDHDTHYADIRHLLSRHQFREARHNLLYCPLTFTDAQQQRIEKKTTKLHLDRRRYVLAFNPELAALAHRHRQERVAAFCDWVDLYNQDLKQALGNRSKTVVDKTITQELKRRRLEDIPLRYTLQTYTVKNRNAQGVLKCANTYRITVNKLQSQDYAASRTYDGLWILVTNLSSQNEAALLQQVEVKSCCDIYRMRQKIEESFRILSDVVGLEPFYVYLPDHIKAHFTICILSYLLDLSILTKIRQTDVVENMDLHRVFSLLNACKQDWIQLDDTTVLSKLTRLTEEQRVILEAVECEHVVSPAYLQQHHIVSENPICA